MAQPSDLRLKIASATPEELEGIIRQAVREAVGSVLRVKPDTLRDDQPLTDLGLDSLMGVEIENSIESSLGVSLPPASLIRARTIGQIVALIAEHLGAKPVDTAPAAALWRQSQPPPRRSIWKRFPMRRLKVCLAMRRPRITLLNHKKRER